ncbi:MAG: amino acid ABC transporter permease [Gammaproteobacteria bacterium]
MIEFLRGFEEYFGDWVYEMGIASLRTIELMVVSFIIACALGLVVALLRISPYRAVRRLAMTYIGFFRGVPVLVILYWIYFALPEMGYEFLVISSYTAAVLGLGIHGSAFLAEVFRSGIEALHHGQMEAALSLGMTPAKAMRWIVLPQSVRIVLPPLANYAVGLLKDTALCSIIAAPELMLRAKDLASSSFLPMHAFVLAAVFYYVMSFPMMRGVEYLENRMGQGRA